MKGQNELRKEKRFLTEDRAIACLNDPSMQFPIAYIIDISKGGLSFQYIKPSNILDKNNNFDLNILFDDKIVINKVPIQIVSDEVLVQGYLTMRRCGVKFGDLSDCQQVRLDEYIKNYTIGTA